jgi:hypothetical protein
LNGTASGVTATVDFETTTGIVAAPSQSWTSSFFYRTFSGSGAPNNYRFRMNGRTAAGAGVSGNSFNTTIFSPTSVLTRYERSETLTSDVSIERVTNGVQFDLTNGAAYDFTFDVGWPQMELGLFASSPVLPPVGAPAATARSADSISLALADFGLASLPEYTVVASALAGSSTISTNQSIVELHNGTADEVIQLVRRGSGGNARGFVITSGVEQGPLDANLISIPTGAAYTVAFGVKSNDLAITFNGSAVAIDTSAAVPTVLTTMHLGGARAGDRAIASTLRRVAVYPRRLTNAQLQTIAAGV